MGATLQQPPAGYDVVKCASLNRYLVIIYDVDAKGRVVGTQVLAVDGQPQFFAKRGGAVNAARFHQITTKAAALEAQLYRLTTGIDHSQPAARSVS